MLNPWKDVAKVSTNYQIVSKVESYSTVFGIVSMLGCSLSAEAMRNANNLKFKDDVKSLLIEMGFS